MPTTMNLRNTKPLINFLRSIGNKNPHQETKDQTHPKQEAIRNLKREISDLQKAIKELNASIKK